MFEEKRDQLNKSLNAAHAAYYRAEVFGGPSLYFHQTALRAAADGDFPMKGEVATALPVSIHRTWPRWGVAASMCGHRRRQA